MDGLRIGVTSSRRAEQLTAALERRGAEVVMGSTLGGDIAASDEALAAATDRVVELEPDWFVATTGKGMSCWIEAAERTGHLDDLREVVHSARRICRGNKALGGLRRIDADAEWISSEQTDADVVRWLDEHLDGGERVVVQLHGSATHHPYGSLEDRVELVTVTPYESVPPDDPTPARELIRRTLDGEMDVLTFTSPGAVRGLFEVADGMGAEIRSELDDVLAGPVAIAAVGPVTGGAFEHFDLEPDIVPDRYRTGDLIRAIEDWATTGVARRSR